jgi:drug/metabolite transporter (DMT)-like permease
VISLAYLPLGDAYTLYFSAPVMLTAAAALFLREPVGVRRWAAVLAGFAGVVVAAGAPGTWQLAALLPLLAAALSVARDFATRSVSPEVNAGTVALATAIVVTLGGLATLPFAWTPPTPVELALCLAAAAGAGAGYVLFAVALRTGELSFISPFRYAGVPAAMLLGLLVWGDVPSWRTLLGAAIIVGSGLFILRRERRLTPLPTPP